VINTFPSQSATSELLQVVLLTQKFMRKKLKYVFETRLPFPSQQIMLCIRAEGADSDLKSIAFSTLGQLLELKLKKLARGIHTLVTPANKTSARKRDAIGRFVRNNLLPVVSENNMYYCERAS
jgi:hypothetical protein